MAKYLFRTSYTQAGVAGLIREGGTGRRDALRQTVEGLGGTLEGFYYAFGDDDLLLITDLPDVEAAAAFSMFARLRRSGVTSREGGGGGVARGGVRRDCRCVSRAG